MSKNEETNQLDNILYNKTDSSVSSFISFLIATFNYRGINLFEGFKLVLVIFSKDYASSVSCLENLVKHLESSRCNRNSYKVVPVFYNVSRSVVEKQSKTFSDAFTELERSYPADHVSKWRYALAETAKLDGHEYNEKLSEESEFLDEIAEAVFEKLYPTKEIGIHKLQLNIENLFCKQEWGLRTLGIFGETGIGKTVLARALYRRMIGSYDASLFVKDFQTDYDENKLEPLPRDLFCMIPMEKFDLNDSCSEPCYRQKRVLIVLDDVRNAKDAVSFLGRFDQFDPGSFIIITSRDNSVVKQCKMNENYELKGLTDDDALKLFTRCAFGNELREPFCLDFPMKVMIEKSGGNPSKLISYAENLKTALDSALLEICQKISEVPVHIADASIETMKRKSLCIIPYQNDYQLGVLDTTETNQECQKYLTNVQSLPELDNQILLPESAPSDQVNYRLDHDPVVQPLSQHSHRKPPVIYQGFACQISKFKFWSWEGYYKRFSMLKRIKLGNLVTLVEVEDISEASHLEQIDLRDCTSLESIPDTDKLEHLKVLNLSGCNGIKRYPDIVRTIRELNLEGTGLQEIRSETIQYSKLVKQQSDPTTLESTQSL